MDGKPIEVIDLAATAGTGLSHYSRTPPTLTVLRGKLAQVCLGSEPVVILRNVRGLKQNDLCSAEIDVPSPGLDRLLLEIGKDGDITIVGMGTARRDTTARIRVRNVRTINGRTLQELRTEGEKADTEPLGAAELVRISQAGLERYERPGPTPTRVAGRLKDVGGNQADTLYMVIDRIDGLPPDSFCITELRYPSKATDQLLQEIGEGGRIAVTGLGRIEPRMLSAVRLNNIETINDVSVTSRS